MQNKKHWSEWLWDAWCVASVIGIWPRFIEPHLLTVKCLNLPIPHLPQDLEGLKILQFSDLHWNKHFSLSFLYKIKKRINKLNPDIIVFTGDLLSRARLENEEPIREFFSSLKASIGCFFILGNHDYEQFATINAAGDYDVEETSEAPNIVKGFKRLFKKPILSGRWTAAVKNVQMNQKLRMFLAGTPFKLLCNETILVPYKNSFINICGLEEYMLGRLNVKQTFLNYNPQYPGIILCHNPDAVPLLKDQPGDLVLCGHTHGGQIYLPWFRTRFSCMENPHLLRGLKREGNKWVYINRGVGSVLPFRWFSMPELTLITLRREK